MKLSRPAVVTVGEALAVFNSPVGVALEHAATLEATFAGAESNLAIGLARLGHGVRWASVLGEDPFGRRIFTVLQSEGVDVSGVRWSGDAPTAVMFKCRRDPAAPVVHYRRAGSAMSLAGPSHFPNETWRDAKVLFLTGITPALSPGCFALVHHAAAEARAQGVQVWFDPNHRPRLWSEQEARRTLVELLPKVDCVLAGQAESEMITGETEPHRIAAALRGEGPRHVVIRTGGEEAVSFEDGRSTAVPAFPLRQVIDPVGAGDAFNAGYLAAWLEQQPPDSCLRRGHAAAAIVCQTSGDWEGLPCRAELGAFLDRNDVTPRPTSGTVAGFTPPAPGRD